MKTTEILKLTASNKPVFNVLIESKIIHIGCCSDYHCDFLEITKDYDLNDFIEAKNIYSQLFNHYNSEWSRVYHSVSFEEYNDETNEKGKKASADLKIIRKELNKFQILVKWCDDEIKVREEKTSVIHKSDNIIDSVKSAHKNVQLALINFKDQCNAHGQQGVVGTGIAKTITETFDADSIKWIIFHLEKMNETKN